VTDAAVPPGGTEVLDPPWDPWRPADIARLPAGVTVPLRCPLDSPAFRVMHQTFPGHPWTAALDRARAGLPP
jgi:hypothetical protein